MVNAPPGPAEPCGRTLQKKPNGRDLAAETFLKKTLIYYGVYSPGEAETESDDFTLDSYSETNYIKLW